MGVSIKDMMHERAWIKNDIFSVEVKVMVETRNRCHTKSMFTQLCHKYDKIRLINGKFISAKDLQEEGESGGGIDFLDDLFAMPLTSAKDHYVKVIPHETSGDKNLPIN